MQNNLKSPSDLRQWIDVIGARFSPETTAVDPALILKTCQLISMEACNTKKPLPDDVFAPGWNEQLARCTLSAMCQAVVQMLQVQMSARLPKR